MIDEQGRFVEGDRGVLSVVDFALGRFEDWLVQHPDAGSHSLRTIRRVRSELREMKALPASPVAPASPVEVERDPVCGNCQRPAERLRVGECQACYRFRRRTGRARAVGTRWVQASRLDS